MRIEPASFAFTVLLGLFAALPAFSIDLSAPTLVLLPGEFASTPMWAGLTLSLFMGGFALGQLGGGLLSDRRGRRPVLLLALVVYVVAGAACGGAFSIEMLVLCRLIQGIGAGACSVQAFAMVQDLFEGDAARSKRSYVTVVFGVVPMFAPAVGAVLTRLAGWRSVHWSLAAGGLLLLLVTWLGVGESRRPRSAAYEPTPAETGRMWHDKPFVALAAANALSYGCIFAYVAGSPVVIIDILRQPPEMFAVVFAIGAAALTTGAWVSARLGRRGVPARTLLMGSLSSGAAGAAGLAICCITEFTVGVVLAALLVVVSFSRGVIAPNLQHLAISRRGHQSGAASAVVGVTQLLSGALASGVVALLVGHIGAAAVAAPMLVLSTAALVVWRSTLGQRGAT